MRVRRALLLIALPALVQACRTGISYTSPSEPRYFGEVPATASTHAGDTLTIASFNLEFAQRVDSALAMFAAERPLGNADIVLLQEMDSSATRRIAAALGMGYVYYPAIFNLRTQRDFGNAVLSRWPIVEDAKLMLPHLSRYARTHRIATAATIRIKGNLVRVYSTHLGTVADIRSTARRAQLSVILNDAERFPRAVIGGDLNSGSVGRVATERGFRWPTEHGPRTTRFGVLDHIFVKGLAPLDSAASGTVLEDHHSSDHRAVWVRVRLLHPEVPPPAPHHVQ